MTALCVLFGGFCAATPLGLWRIRALTVEPDGIPPIVDVSFFCCTAAAGPAAGAFFQLPTASCGALGVAFAGSCTGALFRSWLRRRRLQACDALGSPRRPR